MTEEDADQQDLSSLTAITVIIAEVTNVITDSNNSDHS